MAQDFERPFPIPKEYLDTLNSLTWFLADASWMTGSMELGHALMVPTILSGIVLIYIDRRRTQTLINIAILSWICMNTVWMSSEFFEAPKLIHVSQMFFAVGCLFIAAAVITSGSYRETFSHFKRFRFLNFK